MHLVAWTEHEGAALLRMVMHVDKSENALGLFSFAVFDQLLHGCDLWFEDIIYVAVLGFFVVVAK